MRKIEAKEKRIVVSQNVILLSLRRLMIFMHGIH